MKTLSIIVPCFNEAESVEIFYDTTKQVVDGMDVDCEFLFVNDGSSDETLEKLCRLAEADPHVKYISFSRNFGKEAAMLAGFTNASGDYVVVMDADLQDPPELLPEMMSIIETGEYDSVATRRTDRKGEPPVRSWFARQFYKFINKHSDSDIVDGARDYRLMTKEMVASILALQEYNRFSKGIYGWVGFRTYWMTFENVPRVAGSTKWNFWGLVRYAIDGIMGFSDAPLKFASIMGASMTGASVIALIFIIIRKLVQGDPVAGWASTICIIIFIGGVQLAVLGILGEYLAKTYMETKRRPHFIVSKSNIEDVIRIR